MKIVRAVRREERLDRIGVSGMVNEPDSFLKSPLLYA